MKKFLSVLSLLMASATLAAARRSSRLVRAPATVAKPPVITECSSLFVIVRTNGFTSSGASVCPTKMFPAAERLSAPGSTVTDMEILGKNSRRAKGR